MKTKKILALVLTVIMLFSLFCFSVSAEDVFCKDGSFWYSGWWSYTELSENEVYIAAYVVDEPLEGELIIPDTIAGYKVVMVGLEGADLIVEPPRQSFKNSDIEKLVIPEGVREIGTETFSGCKKLKEVVLPDSLESIGAGAFFGCTSLESIVIPGTVKKIGDRAFYGCSALENVTINEGVKGVGCESFSGCNSLRYVIIPESVERIEPGAFGDCDLLRDIIVLSTDCEYSHTGYGKYESIVRQTAGINGYPNSTAQTYAEIYGNHFFCLHSFGEWKTDKEPTFVNEGFEFRECPCGQGEGRSIPRREPQNIVEHITAIFQKIMQFIQNLFKF